jgi:gliding motility-associated-like protein
VAFDEEICPGEVVGFPAHNDGIPVTDVLYGGVSIVNAPSSGMPLVANATQAGTHWSLSSLEALPSEQAWEQTLTLVDTCGYETESVVRVRDCLIPNVFTPDNSSGNNTFRVRGLTGFKGSKLLVFNRYGTEVWKDDTLDDLEGELVWDGTYMNGDDVPDGHYQWVLIRSDGERSHGGVHVFRKP